MVNGKMTFYYKIRFILTTSFVNYYNYYNYIFGKKFTIKLLK